MSLGLLLPAGLLALAALLLPVLLHLDQTPQARPTDFAALRWLSAKLRPRRRLQLQEWWLLLLRLLLVAAIALLFARPVLFGADGGKPWVLVAPGADLALARKQQALSSAQWHWLARGFPSIDAPLPDAAQPLASLLREIDARLPAKTAITVFVPERIGGLDGERPRLSRRIDWQILPAMAPAAIKANLAPAPRLVVRYADDRLPSLRYLRAAAIAWGASAADGIDAASSSQPIPHASHWLVWLVPGELPTSIRAWIENGGTAVVDAQCLLPAGLKPVVLWRDEHGDELANVVAMGRGRLIKLRRALQPQTMPVLLDAEFPAQLRALFEIPAPAPQQASAAALRPLPGGPVFAETPRPIETWLSLLVALLFLLERWFASAPRRG
jgi:hypothetical protein